MSEERQETIEDIVHDIRAQNQGLPEDGYALSPLVCDLLSIADRIEKAAKHQFREVTKMIPHEEVDVSKMETTTPTSEKSSSVGNAAAMREALEQIRELLSIGGKPDTAMCIRYEAAYLIAKEALSVPPRNCDVGTAEEQYARVRAFCKRHKVGLRCVDCTVNGVLQKNCALIWSQMPYDEGGAK